MSKICLMGLIAISLPIMAGCGMAAKTLVETARGGTTEIQIISPVQNLQAYQHIDFKPFTSAVGGLLSEARLNELNNKINTELSKFKNETEPGKRLRLSGSIIHIVDGVYEKEIIVQVRLQDASDGRSLGMANITGMSNSIRGLKEGVYSVADGLLDFLAQNHFPGLKGASLFSSLTHPVTLEQTQ